MKKIDPWATLDVQPGMLETELKSKYKILARKYHPDNKESGDEDKFKLIQRAWNFLSTHLVNKKVPDPRQLGLVPQVEKPSPPTHVQVIFHNTGSTSTTVTSTTTTSTTSGNFTLTGQFIVFRFQK